MHPYVLLNVDEDCSDAEVRAAYLQAVKQFTPETHPERFSDIQAAYAKIKDERARIRWYLFDKEMPATGPFDVLARLVRLGRNRTPPRLDQFKEMLRKCAINR